MKLGSWRTCPYQWLGLGWTELLAVELASLSGGRGSPEWLNTMARGGSEGSAVSRQHQQTPNAPPEQLLELERHRRAMVVLRGRRSPLVGATARGLPDRAAARLRVRGDGVEWCVARNQGEGAIYSRSEGGRVAAGALWTRGER